MADYQPLLPSSSTPTGLFNDGVRPVRNRTWAKVYLGAVGTVFLGGIVSCFTSNNKAFFNAESYGMDSCPVHHGRLLQADPFAEMSTAYNHPVWPLLLVAAASLGSGWLFLLSFKHYAGVMVKVSLGTLVTIPTLMGLILLFSDIWPAGLSLLCTAAIFAALIYYNRGQIELVTRLLGISSRAITETPGITGLGVGIQALQVFILIPLYAIFAVEAMATGKVVRNQLALSQHVPTSRGWVSSAGPKCMDANRHVVSCCTFETNAWGISYMIILIVCALWTNMLIGQIQSFTVAGAVAQWYFTPAWIGPSTGVDKPGQGRVMKSLRHALGPSFGSLCASAAVLGVINMLQEWLRSCERQARMRHPAAILFWVLALILRSLLSLVEFLTRMTTARMAITGEAFFDAAHSTYAIMKRNGLEALGVWWMPRYILVTTALVTGMFYSFLLFGLGELVWAGDAVSSFVLAWIGFYVSYVIIVFFCVLLLNAVDGAFMCFLMDRDAARVTRQDVHDILKGLPGLQGQVVELPDGDLMYGAPATSAQQQQQKEQSGAV